MLFDEFGGIFGDEGAAGLLRTKLQHHFEEIGLPLAGAQPTLMREMFSLGHMPFSAQADLIEIEPFDATMTERVVADGFRATDRLVGAGIVRVDEDRLVVDPVFADWITERVGC